MTTRGDFLSSAMASGAVALCAPPHFPSVMRKPPVVRKGDRVGLVAPASPLTAAEIENGVAHMRSLGLVPVLGRYVHEAYGYLAGGDAQRLEDFNHMIRDPQIRAIVALRGGYGSMRILDGIDYAALRAHPKVVMGFSDITAMLNAIAQRSGIVTFHGPVAAIESHYGAQTRSFIERAWMSRAPIGELHANATRHLHRGVAHGRLAGGNLSLVAALEGTSYAIASADSLLILEDTAEEPYEVDRMLTQLRLAGTLERANGIIFGRCTDCEADGDSLHMDQVLDDRIGTLGYPAISGAPIGHIETQWVLPIGIEATLDANRSTLTIPESAVV